MRSLICPWCFTADTLSLGTALPACGCPPAHGSTPRGPPNQHPRAKCFILFPPQEKAVNEGSPAHTAALWLNHCRGSLCGASADPSLGLPCRQQGGGLHVMQVPLASCCLHAPQILEAAVFGWGAASQSPCRTRERSGQTLSKTCAIACQRPGHGSSQGPGSLQGWCHPCAVPLNDHSPPVQHVGVHPFQERVAHQPGWLEHVSIENQVPLPEGLDLNPSQADVAPLVCQERTVTLHVQLQLCGQQSLGAATWGKEPPAPVASQMKLIPQLFLQQTPKSSQCSRKSCRCRDQLWV